MLTRTQTANEAMIQASYQNLIAAKKPADQLAYWRLMVASIKGRDPEVTEALEQARLRRVGL